jgi:hypothetical protein
MSKIKTNNQKQRKTRKQIQKGGIMIKRLQPKNQFIKARTFNDTETIQFYLRLRHMDKTDDYITILSEYYKNSLEYTRETSENYMEDEYEDPFLFEHEKEDHRESIFVYKEITDEIVLEKYFNKNIEASCKKIEMNTIKLLITFLVKKNYELYNHLLSQYKYEKLQPMHENSASEEQEILDNFVLRDEFFECEVEREVIKLILERKGNTYKEIISISSSPFDAGMCNYTITFADICVFFRNADAKDLRDIIYNEGYKPFQPVLESRKTKKKGILPRIFKKNIKVSFASSFDKFKKIYR